VSNIIGKNTINVVRNTEKERGMMNVKIDGITAATDKFDVHDIVFHIRLAWDDEEHGFGLIDISQYRNGQY